MTLKPTALAYLRVMIAHLAGRIQPPAISPLADGKRQRLLSRPAPVAALPAETTPVPVPAHAGREA